MSEDQTLGEIDRLRDRNRELGAELAKLRLTLAKKESELVKVLLTLDDEAQFHFRPHLDYDTTLQEAMGKLFREPSEILRVAIPYLTPGGLRDFRAMLGEALESSADIRVVFRAPSKRPDFEIHEEVNRQYALEVGSGKLAFRYLGTEGKSGLHAKVILKDSDFAIVSSANWTGYALSINAEAGLLTTSKRAVRMLAHWYDYIFDAARGWSPIHREWAGEE